MDYNLSPNNLPGYGSEINEETSIMRETSTTRGYISCMRKARLQSCVIDVDIDAVVAVVLNA
ncbi:hypothetical protein J6590_062199 [Homalodisca vitripennis]|nr:hypothetical protein J6590_062199 [Homalodisca vitripennis]